MIMGLLILLAAATAPLAMASGRACAIVSPTPTMPTWKPSWNWTESRFAYIANYKGGIDMNQSYISLSSPMGLVGLDWTVSVGAWFNKSAGRGVGNATCEAVSRENCRRLKASGMLQRCCIYHNTELALGWLASQRVAMDDPSKRDFFLQYKNGSIYSEDINFGRQWLWNHSNPQASAYFVSSIVGSLTVDDSADCTFTDDTCGLPEEHPLVTARIGMTPVELLALQKATIGSRTKLGAALAKAGKWLGSAGGSITGAMNGATFPGQKTPGRTSACTKFMDMYCAAAKQTDVMTLNADWKYAVNQSIAAFLITRPPVAFVGKVPTVDMQLQPGVPMPGAAGLCKTEGSGVYSRAWTAGVARLDCAAWTSELPFPSINITSATVAKIKTDDWWQYGAAPYPLQVPHDLIKQVAPIWAPNTTAPAPSANSSCPVCADSCFQAKCNNTVADRPQFVFARKEFELPPKTLKHAVVFVTAQQSEYCPPNQYTDLGGSHHLELGVYGSCIFAGGTTQPKLLGAYKLSINGVVVGMGPGRRVNQTQGVDALDVTSAVVKGENCVALQGFHTNKWGDQPRFLLLLRLTFLDGSVRDVSTGADWRTRSADGIFNPEGTTGAWAKFGPWGTYGLFPQEMIDMRKYPTGWQKAGFVEDASWQPADVAAPFVLPLRNKPSRPISVWTRQAAKVTAHAGTAEAPCNNCYIMDFGLEMQGGVNLTFSADTIAGHVVTVLLSEELRADGTPLVPMLTRNNFTYVWTLRQGAQSVSAHEYVEFRYAIVLNAPEPLTPAAAGAWVVRYPHSDEEQDSYGDAPALPLRSPLRRPAALAAFSSDSVDLNAVWGLVRHTIVATTLDVNTDSNTRQRDLCHLDAFITSLAQLSISNEPGTATMTTMDAFQLDSNIWKGTWESIIVCTPSVCLR